MAQFASCSNFMVHILPQEPSSINRYSTIVTIGCEESSR